MLSLNNVSLKKNDKYLIENITLEIPLSRITLLLGKSGSGKTTILRCIAQLENRYTGDILFERDSISTYSIKQRAQVLGFLSQSFALFPHMNALKNCMHPLRTLLGLSKHEATERALNNLTLLDMQKYALNRPQELSGGQQQRVAIARALGLNPSYLLLDEPTSALDPENTTLLIQIIKTLLKQNKGIVVSSQDMAFAGKIMDRVYFLANGSIKEEHDIQQESSTSTKKDIHKFLYDHSTEPVYSTLQLF